MSASIISPLISRLEILALSPPSTRTLTTPPGSFKICFIFATVPTSKRSSLFGSSTSSSLCATKNIFESCISDLSIAFTEIFLPQSKCMTMWGKITKSRRGISGNFTFSIFHLLKKPCQPRLNLFLFFY